MKRLALGLVVLVLSGCGFLHYPALDIHEPIIPGGQSELDKGYVVRVDLPNIWIAGHRTEDGAVFANLLNAKIGDRVCAYDVCYKVVGFTTLPQGQLIEIPHLATLVLQTSLDADTAFLVLAEPDG